MPVFILCYGELVSHKQNEKNRKTLALQNLIGKGGIHFQGFDFTTPFELNDTKP